MIVSNCLSIERRTQWICLHHQCFYARTKRNRRRKKKPDFYLLLSASLNAAFHIPSDTFCECTRRHHREKKKKKKTRRRQGRVHTLLDNRSRRKKILKKMNVFVRKSSCSLLFVNVLLFNYEQSTKQIFKFSSSSSSFLPPSLLAFETIRTFIYSFNHLSYLSKTDKPVFQLLQWRRNKKKKKDLRIEMISVLIRCFYAWVHLQCF